MASGVGNMKEFCEAAKENVDMARIRRLHFLPKTKEMYETQYIYSCQNFMGNMVPLTGKVIDDLLLTPVYGQSPQVDKGFIKKTVIVGDALFLPEFLQSHLIKSDAGVFLDIFPHQYVVPSNDIFLHKKCSVGFIEVINKSRNAFTIGSLMADNDLLYELLCIQPDCVNFNIGLSDIMLENVSWHPKQISKEFVRMIEELIAKFQTYFFSWGSRGAFAENLTYTFNMLPMYAALDAERHNVLAPIQVIQHTNLWGTSYHNVTRKEYKELADDINKKLHSMAEILFGKFQLVLLKPTPRWVYGDLHVDRKSGLPSNDIHQEMLSKFFFALGRVMCDRKVCTLGVNSSRNMRSPDTHLNSGCAILYQNTLGGQQ